MVLLLEKFNVNVYGRRGMGMVLLLEMLAGVRVIPAHSVVMGQRQVPHVCLKYKTHR